MKNQMLFLSMRKSVVPVFAFLGVLFAGCMLAPAQMATAQSSSSDSKISKLESIVSQQQRALEQQQAQILALQSAMAEQQRILSSVVQGRVVQGRTSDVALVRVADRKAADDLRTRIEQVTAPVEETAAPVEQASAPMKQQPLTHAQAQEEEELQRGQEIADVTPTTPALELGPAKLRLIGYPALTTVWRSTNNGGNVATNFNNIPYSNTVPGTTSELRLSPQNTRLAIRVDADLKSSYAAGYYEMDFVGPPANGNLVTQSGYPFRIRQAWFDWRKGKWEMAGGQLWSLMTPNKEGILPWPGDVAVTQVIDLNFVAGVVVGRYPQFRLVYRPSQKMTFGFSIENPEQQVSNSVVFPSALSNTLTTQYNAGSNGLNIPNMTPDFVFKGSFDNKLPGDRAVHLDVGTVMRTFRSWDGVSPSGKDYAFGWGVGANFTAEVTKRVRWVLDGFASDGAGRYIGGLAPDVIVRANGDISPIHSYSWVTGLEIAPNKATGFYAYYSGLYAQKNSALNSDGSCCVGFGFPGASTAADRLIEEATGGYSRVMWKYENLGSVQWGIQYAHVWVYPWVAGSGPNSAHTNMVFTQLRYNLP